jgi:sporulation protein YlmC with PRC-barrel domain
MDNVKETSSLIASDKVEGVTVFNTTGESIGSIHDLMIDKMSGKVAYAVMSFGGFLGVGANYHPIPWPMLKYDTNMGGYVVDLDKTEIEGAPSFPAGAEPDWSNRDYETKLHGYYDVGPYWMI